jgi:hypothetical protein
MGCDDLLRVADLGDCFDRALMASVDGSILCGRQHLLGLFLGRVDGFAGWLHDSTTSCLCAQSVRMDER